MNFRLIRLGILADRRVFEGRATIGSVNPDLEPSDPARLWAELLSREPERILRALESLPGEDRRRIQDHLERMATEPGWHPPQRESARAALEALRDAPDPMEKGR